MEAALKAEELREMMVAKKKDFTFETVLSTERNLLLLKKAKANGFFVRGIYVLTIDPQINVFRVNAREALGGHGVPTDKIISRYNKAMELIPELVDVCDVLHVYDNSEEPFRIFKKRKGAFYHWSNEFWSFEQISKLTGIKDYVN